MSFDTALHQYPIIQAVHALFIVCALPPVTVLIFLLRRIALHVNCKFLLYAWLSAFLVGILTHASFAICDIASGKYIPSSNSDPEIRLLVFGVHGFVHAFSSAQEFLFSIERAIACADPSKYHDRSLSKIPLLFAEIVAIALALVYSILLGTDRVLEGCLITNIIDCLSLVVRSLLHSKSNFC